MLELKRKINSNKQELESLKAQFLKLALQLNIHHEINISSGFAAQWLELKSAIFTIEDIIYNLEQELKNL